jgi:hypothetical protein
MSAARRLSIALLTLAVLVTGLVALPIDTARAVDPTPPGVPAGAVKIPHQLHHFSATIEAGQTADGPWGYCYDGYVISFDAAYGTPYREWEDPLRYSYYEILKNNDGTTSARSQRSVPSSGVFLKEWQNLTQNSDIETRVVGDLPYGHLTFASANMVNQVYSGSFTEEGGPSQCSPSVRSARQASWNESLSDKEFWTARPFVSPVDLTITVPEGPFEVGEDVPGTWTLENHSEQTATLRRINPSSGLLNVGLDVVDELSDLPVSLAPGETVTRPFTVRPRVKAIGKLWSEITVEIDGEEFVDSGYAKVDVQPDVDVVLSTDVTSETKTGDTFNVTATITNNDDEVELFGLDSEFLWTSPVGPVKWSHGPVTASGEEPADAEVVVPPGGSTTLHWTYLAEEPGVVDLTAFITGQAGAGFEWGPIELEASTTVAIESAELALSDVRLQPSAIVPGQFGNVRGTVTNTGTSEVRDIDFALGSAPELQVVDGVLADLDPSVSPRIATLGADESREFMIPVAMVMDAGELATYRATLDMVGTSTIGGEDVEVSGQAVFGEGLDLTPYWSTILDDVRANLLSDTIEFFEGINEWGDSSTLGGVTVGSSEGALAAFQKLGDGLLTLEDFIEEEIDSGGARLTATGRAVTDAVIEYLHTNTAQEMMVDLANLEEDVAFGGLDIFTDWLRKVEVAARKDDVREVSKLLAEPATEVAVGLGVERAAGKVFSDLVGSAVGRKVVSYMKRAPEPVDEDWIWLPEPDYTPDKLVARELQDLKDMPTGVAITGETVARAGLTADEHGWMIEMAREHGVAFFVRPRPESAIKFAKLGYNAKPMAIKLKSINEIDHKWLGWDDYADSEGLVVFRKPKDPLEAMKEAVEAGELEYGGPEIDAIIERYNLRLAEWKSFEKPFGDAGPTVDPTEGILHKLNGDVLNPDGSISPGDGFSIQRYGKTVRTKATIDGDGVIRFSHNNQPVYSDIDLLAIAKPDGSPIDPELHRLISERGGAGIDSQHGDSVLTSDFPNWDVAKRFGEQYAREHMRGGDPLIIVQPDVTTLGYVDSIAVPEGPIPGSGYDLYGKMSATYEGAGKR